MKGEMMLAEHVTAPGARQAVDGPVGLTAVEAAKLEQYQVAVNRYQQRVLSELRPSESQCFARPSQPRLAMLRLLPECLKNPVATFVRRCLVAYKVRRSGP